MCSGSRGSNGVWKSRPRPRSSGKAALGLVPSQSGKGRYTVIPHAKRLHCYLPGPSKTVATSASTVRGRIRRCSGNQRRWHHTVTETVTVQKTVQEDLPAKLARIQRRADAREREFLELLRDLCSGVDRTGGQVTGVRACLFRMRFSRPLQGLQHGLGAPVHERPARRASQGLHQKDAALQFDLQLSGKSRLTPILRDADHAKAACR